MSGMGLALMGTGVGEGQDRAVDAARKAVNSPLLDDLTIQGARGVLINITASESLTLHGVNEANTLIQDSADQNAHIIFGSVLDEGMEDRVNVLVVATGFGDSEAPRVNEKRGYAMDNKDEVPLSPLQSDMDLSSPSAPTLNREVDVPAFLRQNPGNSC